MIRGVSVEQVKVSGWSGNGNRGMAGRNREGEDRQMKVGRCGGHHERTEENFCDSALCQ